MVVRMVLVGKIGRDIVRAVQVSGGSAVGLSGEDCGLITAVQRDPKLGYVGDVAVVNPRIVEEMLDSGIVPIVSSIGADDRGQAYNINADAVAAALAGALKAAKAGVPHRCERSADRLGRPFIGAFGRHG